MQNTLCTLHISTIWFFPVIYEPRNLNSNPAIMSVLTFLVPPYLWFSWAKEFIKFNYCDVQVIHPEIETDNVTYSAEVTQLPILECCLLCEKCHSYPILSLILSTRVHGIFGPKPGFRLWIWTWTKLNNNFYPFLIRWGGMVNKLSYVRFSQIIYTHFVCLQHYLSKIESGCWTYFMLNVAQEHFWDYLLRVSNLVNES